MDYFALIACAVILLLSYWWFWSASRNLPPGPIRIFGNLCGSTWNEGINSTLNLKKQYGDICCIRVLGTPCIYLNTHARIRQFYITHGDKFAGRLDFSGIKHRMTMNRGIIQSDGQTWQEHRRFALSTLRDFGFGRGATEQIIQSELQQLTEHLQSYDGKTVDPRLALNMATCNVICSLVFGERCGNEPGFEPVYKMIAENIDGPLTKQHEVVLRHAIKLSTMFPTLLDNSMLRNLDKVCDYLETKVDAHKKAFNGQVRDVIDAYLLENEGKGDGSHSHETFCDGELFRTIVDFFIAGMETTASTLRWALFLMVTNQQVQRRVQAELDEVLQHRVPNAADRKQLPYLDAVLMEVQRYVTLTPFGAVPHRCTEQVQLDQYVIPKDALVFANLLAAHRDDAIWPDPMQFNPDNFYNHDKSLKNTEYLIPFSVGKRSCLGESLAKQELFVLFAGLMQKFEVSAPEGEPFPDVQSSRFGRLVAPPKFKVVFNTRSAQE